MPTRHSTPQKLEATDESLQAQLKAKAAVPAELCNWYQQVARDLPWRKTQDIYALWVSEIMLQQTQVATVLPYYERFLQRFPTVQALAKAELDEVLKHWEGLGYYGRARNLHKAAQVVVSEHAGVFPKSLEAVEALPGIGLSTAGAILTFATAHEANPQRHPILDGNVKRVLCRLIDEPEAPVKPAVLKRLWQTSNGLLQKSEDAYTFNQALMELGATICLPRKPKCLVCPLRSNCSAAEAGTQDQRPVKVEKKPVKHHAIGVGVLQNERGEYLIQKRPETGLLAGLWEFPGGKQEPGETLETTVVRELQEELGIEVEVLEHLLDVPHAYTHFKVTLHTYSCRLISGEPKPKAAQELRWVPLGELDAYAFPRANSHIIKRLKALTMGLPGA